MAHAAEARWEVVYEYVAVRSEKATTAVALDFKRRGAVVCAKDGWGPDADGWIAIDVDEETKRRYGTERAFMLTDGAAMGLPVLLKRIDVSEKETLKPAPEPASYLPEPSDKAPWGETVEQAAAIAMKRLQKAQAAALAKPPYPSRSANNGIRRIYATSDIHTDHEGNMSLVARSWPEAPPGSALIVAGDVSHVRQQVIETFKILLSKYDHVFFVPGNHDLWVLGAGGRGVNGEPIPQDSLELLCSLAECVGELGVKVLPTSLSTEGGEEVIVAPMFSWYDAQFLERDRSDPSSTERNFDAACKWPSPVGFPDKPRQSYGRKEIGEFMANLNTSLLFDVVPRSCKRRPQEDARTIVSFSHFYPNPDLYYGYSGLAKVMGSVFLQDQVFRIRPDVHVFGHSHLDVDRTVGGTRYIQHALGYPKDRYGYREPKLVWTCE